MNFYDIPHSETWQNIQSIYDGYSSDKKYKVTTHDKTSYLLRVSSIDHYDRKKQVYKNLILLKNDLNVSRLVEFGNFDEGKYVYALFTWEMGEVLDECINRFDEITQYKLGQQAGKILKEIHRTPIPLDLEPWEETYLNKVETKVASFKTSEIKLENQDLMLAEIKSLTSLLTCRPLALQHGDFHIGNMVVNQEGKLFVIDFDRIDYGDPFEEFNRIHFCASKSPAFANGMIHAYFDNQVPNEFFKLLKLYVMTNQVSAISWSKAYGKEVLNRAIHSFHQVLKWYEKGDIPIWYKAPEIN